VFVKRDGRDFYIQLEDSELFDLIQACEDHRLNARWAGAKETEARFEKYIRQLRGKD
jgi:hypothetical protein